MNFPLSNYCFRSFYLNFRLLLPVICLFLVSSDLARGQNSAVFVSQTVPYTMTAGQQYDVSVTMKNVGTTTWTDAGNYHLGAIGDKQTWGVTRIRLPNSVTPGNTFTVQFTVTAPLTNATYNFQWCMVQDGVEWFGAPSNNDTVEITDGTSTPLNDAVFVSQSVPFIMTAGQTYPVRVTVKNIGLSTWTSEAGYKLGSLYDATTWGIGRVVLPYSVAPGDTVTFTFNVTAPQNNGTYNFQWGMVWEGQEWFGAVSSPTAITLRGGLGQVTDDAKFISESYSSYSVRANQTFSSTIVMKNVGTTTWSAGTIEDGSYYLVAYSPANNTIWGVQPIPVTGSLAPNQTITFTVAATSPSFNGTYNFRWRMMKAGSVGFFGEPSQDITIAVTGGQPPYGNGLERDVEWISQSVPNNMIPGQGYPVTITMRNTGLLKWTANNSAFRLGSYNPNNNIRWGVSNVVLPNDVPSGATVIFSFNVVAPNTPGTYNFQWRMLGDDGRYFGNVSQNLSVKVAQGDLITLMAIPDNGQVKLLWTSLDGVQQYSVHRATSENGSYALLVNTSNTAYNDLNLTNGTAYYYIISATTPDGLATSQRVSATPKIADGNGVQASLIYASSGYLYGSSIRGGTFDAGTLFRINTNGSFSTIYAFSLLNEFGLNSDGSNPEKGLVQGSDGNLYGSAPYGGSNATGTIFKSTPTGILTAQSSLSTSELTKATDNNFYGASSDGGDYQNGAIFRMSPSGAISIVYSFGPFVGFNDNSTGAQPKAGLVQGSDGCLYGVTSSGGANGTGAVFKVTTAGVFSLLHNFAELDESGNNTDGYGSNARLTIASDGSIFGVASEGGPSGKGTLYEISSSGDFSIVHTFSDVDDDGNNVDGVNPEAELFPSTDGNLYGTTSLGGAYGMGVVFKITPSGSFQTLHAFNGIDGANPFGGLIQLADGSFYGGTLGGGSYNVGVIFQMNGSGSLSLLKNFELNVEF